MERSMATECSRGEHLADLFAAIVGSWTFILVQGILLMIWIGINGIAWIRHWDPYHNSTPALKSFTSSALMVLAQRLI